MLRHRLRTPACIVAAGLGILGCQDEPSPTGPELPLVLSGPASLISDAGHGAGTAHFSFLPPTVIPQPLRPQTFTGVFDPTISTVVRVCEGDGSCGPTNALAAFTPDGGTGGSPLAAIRVNPRFESYSAVWDTRKCEGGPCALDPTAAYRLHVSVLTPSGAEVEIGFADLQVRTLRGGQPPLDLANYSPLISGLPYIIAFRIEEGLSLGATLRGTAPAGFMISIEPPKGEDGFAAATVADENEQWVLTGVPAGTHTVLFRQSALCVAGTTVVEVTDAGEYEVPTPKLKACTKEPAPKDTKPEEADPEAP